MKKKGLRLLAMMLAFCLLTGCNASFFSPENAIKAPAATGIYQGVQAALEKAVGQEIILKYPLVGGTNTAFYPRDLDGDGVQEMLAFYRFPSEGEVTRINLIRNVEDEWQSVQSIDPMGSDIANVDFCDLNGDGKDEVCVGWSVSTTRNNQMCVYQTENGKLVQRAAESYTSHVICDIDGDGIQELGLVALNSEISASSISFYKIQRGDFSMIGSLALDSSVLSYAKVTAARITERNIGVYLDAYKGTDSAITELIYYKDGTLYNPFAGSLDAFNTVTQRYCTLTCTDVNADGWLEIPFMEALPGYSAGDTSLTHHLICWRPYDGEIGKTVKMWWYNTGEGYYLEFDPTHQEKFTVLYDELEQACVFYGWNDGPAGQRLFSVKKYAAAEFESRTDLSYEALYSDAVSVYAASVEEGNSLEITLGSLKKKFNLILK